MEKAIAFDLGTHSHINSSIFLPNWSILLPYQHLVTNASMSKEEKEVSGHQDGDHCSPGVLQILITKGQTSFSNTS